MVLKTYKEVKPHSSEKIKDKVAEGERYNDDNDEYVYYLLMESTFKKPRMEWGVGLGGWELDGV